MSYRSVFCTLLAIACLLSAPVSAQSSLLGGVTPIMPSGCHSAGFCAQSPWLTGAVGSHLTLNVTTPNEGICIVVFALGLQLLNPPLPIWGSPCTLQPCLLVVDPIVLVVALGTGSPVSQAFALPPGPMPPQIYGQAAVLGVSYQLSNAVLIQ